jgi:hypothetical protein
MFVKRKSFGQNIWNPIFCVIIHPFKKDFKSPFSHQMMMNLDMLHASMKDWVI